MVVVIRTAYLRRLDEALDYLLGNGADAAAERLNHEALHELPERLARFSQRGRDFLARNLQMPEVQASLEKAIALLGNDIELREWIMDEYLVLYAIHEHILHLLTLRHHRESGFDFSGGES